MGLGEFGPWHILIVAVVFVVLFGSKKLPDAARSIGRSLRIFKAETRGLREDDTPASELTPTALAAPSPAADGRPAAPVPAPGATGTQQH